MKLSFYRNFFSLVIHLNWSHKDKRNGCINVIRINCKKVKHGVGVEKYLKHVKGPPFRLLFKVCSSTYGHFDELGRHAKSGGSQECPYRGARKQYVERVFF